MSNILLNIMFSLLVPQYALSYVYSYMLTFYLAPSLLKNNCSIVFHAWTLSRKTGHNKLRISHRAVVFFQVSAMCGNKLLVGKRRKGREKKKEKKTSLRKWPDTLLVPVLCILQKPVWKAKVPALFIMNLRRLKVNIWRQKSAFSRRLFYRY